MVQAKRADIDADLAEQGAGLCLSCGLCCNGYLFEHVPLGNEEAGLLIQLDLAPYLRDTPAVAFAQPCSRYREGLCSVYDQRPKACRSYRCHILRNMTQGNTSFEESLRTVKTAKVLMKSVLEYIGEETPEGPQDIWKKVDQFFQQHRDKSDAQDFRRVHGKFLADLEALLILRRQFEPGQTQAELQVALAHHQAGRLADAEVIYRQILAVYPLDPGALHLLGVIARQVGQHGAAVDLISRAISVKADDAAYHFSLGEVYHSLGYLEKAITSYEQALALRPDDPDTHFNLGNALAVQNRLDAATAAYENALKLNSTHADAQNNLGNILMAQGRLDEAIASYERVLQLRPDLAAAYNNLGNALKAKGRLEEAMACYRRFAELTPDQPSSALPAGQPASAAA